VSSKVLNTHGFYYFVIPIEIEDISGVDGYTPPPWYLTYTHGNNWRQRTWSGHLEAGSYYLQFQKGQDFQEWTFYLLALLV